MRILISVTGKALGPGGDERKKITLIGEISMKIAGTYRHK